MNLLNESSFPDFKISFFLDVFNPIAVFAQIDKRVADVFVSDFSIVHYISPLKNYKKSGNRSCRTKNANLDCRQTILISHEIERIYHTNIIEVCGFAKFINRYDKNNAFLFRKQSYMKKTSSFSCVIKNYLA